eukprot:CAMPEP_0182444322 /NCGR_PEP_ID=MMETSP1172-20130603/2812_1 /TAXON_ID=708627 /ORGANISM="Timspurckia oligopyrenoides, Strain CCMP3278" /LENGTH=354 /DNA_ID=CAMNT_0024639855 /DNA_START=1171 /DNA_END=2235 /DNA_ORIENTATION=+
MSEEDMKFYAKAAKTSSEISVQKGRMKRIYVLIVFLLMSLASSHVIPNNHRSSSESSSESSPSNSSSSNSSGRLVKSTRKFRFEDPPKDVDPWKFNWENYSILHEIHDEIERETRRSHFRDKIKVNTELSNFERLTNKLSIVNQIKPLLDRYGSVPGIIDDSMADEWILKYQKIDLLLSVWNKHIPDMSALAEKNAEFKTSFETAAPKATLGQDFLASIEAGFERGGLAFGDSLQGKEKADLTKENESDVRSAYVERDSGMMKELKAGLKMKYLMRAFGKPPVEITTREQEKKWKVHMKQLESMLNRWNNAVQSGLLSQVQNDPHLESMYQEVSEAATRAMSYMKKLELALKQA